MDEHDLDRLALLVVGGRDEEREIQRVRDERRRRARDPRQQRAGQLHEAGRVGEPSASGFAAV